MSQHITMRPHHNTIVSLLIYIVLALQSQARNSTDYTILAETIDGGGSIQHSTTYTQQASFEPTVQSVSTATAGAGTAFELQHGFYQALSGSALSPYHYWILSSGYPDYQEKDFFTNLDLNNDQINNGLAWLLGAETIDSSPPTELKSIYVENNHMVFRYPLPIGITTSSSAHYTPQYSSNLIDWHPATNGVDGISITLNPDTDTTGLQRATLRIPLALSADNQLFTRFVLLNPFQTNLVTPPNPRPEE